MIKKETKNELRVKKTSKNKINNDDSSDFDLWWKIMKKNYLIFVYAYAYYRINFAYASGA